MVSSVDRSSLWSLRLAPSMVAPSGTPRPSVGTERFTPRLPRSVGLRPVFPPAQRRLAHRPVQRQPGPVDAAKGVVGQQPFAPERLEHPGSQPLLEAPVRRGGRADRGLSQGVPLAARAQHEEDRVHRRPVRHPRVVAAQRMLRPRRQQWLHLRPQRVRQPPAVVPNTPSRRLRISPSRHPSQMVTAAPVAYPDTLLGAMLFTLRSGWRR